MTAFDLARAALRFWYITALGLIGTCAVLFSAHPQTVYWTNQVVTLETPAAFDAQPKRLGQVSSDPIPTAEILAALVNEHSSLKRSRSTDATLYGEGFYDTSNARIVSAGSQWVMSVREPKIQVETDGPSPEAVLAKQRRELSSINASLIQLQDRFSVAAEQRITMSVSPEQPEMVQVSGSRTRPMAAIALIGVIVTLSAVYFAERWRRRRLVRTAV